MANRKPPKRLFRSGPSARVVRVPGRSDRPVCALCGVKALDVEGWDVLELRKGPLGGSMMAHCPKCMDTRPDEVTGGIYRALGHPEPFNDSFPSIERGTLENGSIVILREHLENYVSRAAMLTGVGFDEAREGVHEMVGLGLIVLADDLDHMKRLGEAGA